VLQQLHELARLPVASSSGGRRRPEGRRAARTSTTADREAALLAFTTRHSDAPPGRDRGAEVLRLLTDEARLSLLAAHRAKELGELLQRHGRDRTEQLLQVFLEQTPASSWPRDQAEAFDLWLRRQVADVTP
jgi:hypothetical protein